MKTRDEEKKRQANRSRHYWQRINGATGRQKLREATDYIKALLAGRGDHMVEQAVKQVEHLAGVPAGGKETR